MVTYKLSDAFDIGDNTLIAQWLMAVFVFAMIFENLFNSSHCSGWLGDASPAHLSHYLVPVILLWLYLLSNVIDVCGRCCKCKCNYTCLDSCCRYEDGIYEGPPSAQWESKEAYELVHSRRHRWGMIVHSVILLLITVCMGYYNFRWTDEPGIESYLNSIATSYQTSTLMPCVTSANAAEERPCNDQNLANVYSSHYSGYLMSSNLFNLPYTIKNAEDISWKGNLNATWKFKNDSLNGPYCHAESLTSVPAVCAGFETYKNVDAADLSIDCRDTDASFCISLHKCLDFDAPFDAEDFVCSNWRWVWNIYNMFKIYFFIFKIATILYIFWDLCFFFWLHYEWRGRKKEEEEAGIREVGQIGQPNAVKILYKAHEYWRYFWMGTSVLLAFVSYLLFLVVRDDVHKIRDAKCWANPSLLLLTPHTGVSVYISSIFYSYVIIMIQSVSMGYVKYHMFREMQHEQVGYNLWTGEAVNAEEIKRTILELHGLRL